MAVCPRGVDRTTLSAAISFLSKHGRRCRALRCHRGSRKAKETLGVRLVEGTTAGITL